MTTCTIDDCTNAHIARGMCSKHYTRWRTWGDPRFVADRGPAPTAADAAKPECIIDGCASAGTQAEGMCNKHYRRALKLRSEAEQERIRRERERNRVRCMFCEAASILAGKGYSVAEIAAELHKSPRWLVGHLDAHGGAVL